MTYTNILIFQKMYPALMVKIVDLALKAVIDSFEIYTMNSLIKKKSKLFSSCPKLLYT